MTEHNGPPNSQISNMEMLIFISENLFSKFLILIKSSPIYPLGLEQCKARDEKAGKEEGMDEGIGESSKDLLIKRKVPVMGQAISVVGGGYGDKSQTETGEAPQVKRLPEPILPSTQIK